jgi:hypothetical protein
MIGTIVIQLTSWHYFVQLRRKMANLLLNDVDVSADMIRLEGAHPNVLALKDTDFRDAAMALRLSGKAAIRLPGEVQLGHESFYFGLGLMQMDPRRAPLFVGVVQLYHYDGIKKPALELLTEAEVRTRIPALYAIWKSTPLPPIISSLTTASPGAGLITDLDLV